MKILALDFSSPQRSVAVANLDESGRALASGEAMESAPGNGMKPFGLITAALQQAGLEREQIEGIAIGLGPGSYTGIRASIALAQGWQLGRAVKLFGVSSASCIAAQAQVEGLRGRIGVVIDAQRGEFYLAGCEITAGGLEEVSPLRIVSLAAVNERAQAGERLVGPEVTRWFPGGRVVFPRAEMLAQLAVKETALGSGKQIEPIYLRTPTFVKAPPSRVLPKDHLPGQ